jgi:hypothetical protein
LAAVGNDPFGWLVAFAGSEPHDAKGVDQFGNGSGRSPSILDYQADRRQIDALSPRRLMIFRRKRLSGAGVGVRLRNQVGVTHAALPPQSLDHAPGMCAIGDGMAERDLGSACDVFVPWMIMGARQHAARHRVKLGNAHMPMAVVRILSGAPFLVLNDYGGSLGKTELGRQHRNDNNGLLPRHPLLRCDDPMPRRECRTMRPCIGELIPDIGLGAANDDDLVVLCPSEKVIPVSPMRGAGPDPDGFDDHRASPMRLALAAAPQAEHARSQP